MQSGDLVRVTVLTKFNSIEVATMLGLVSNTRLYVATVKMIRLVFYTLFDNVGIPDKSSFV